MSEPRIESPLVGLAELLSVRADGESFEIREQAFLEYAIVRGDARSAELAGAIRSTLDIALPDTPNTVSTGGTHDALWLGPDEWLIVSKVKMDSRPRLNHSGAGSTRGNDEKARGIEDALRPLFAGQFASVVDVSSGYTAIHLAGTRAREVLLKGCPLDLHPRVFGVGLCAQSHFFRAPVIVRPLAADRYELLLRRSFADYAARMLLDAAGATSS